MRRLTLGSVALLVFVACGESSSGSRSSPIEEAIGTGGSESVAPPEQTEPLDETNPVVELPTDVIDIAAGYGNSCAVLRSGEVRCWGILLGSEAGHLINWGDEPAEARGGMPRVNLGSTAVATEVALGDMTACARLTEGTVKCWGQGVLGSLASGSAQPIGDDPAEMGDALPVVAVPAGRTVSQVEVAMYSSCFLLDDGALRCAGAASQQGSASGPLDGSQLGDEPTELGDAWQGPEFGSDRRAIAASLAPNHSCVVLDDGTVRCWGAGGQGALGQGDAVNRYYDEIASLPPIDLGSGARAQAVATTFGGVCALLEGGAMKCWGNPAQLGAEASIGDEAGEMGDALPALDFGSGKAAIDVVGQWVGLCVLFEGGSVRCLDAQRLFEPAYPGSVPDIDFGTGRTAVKIAANGGHHACALLDDGAVKCWGRNTYGELGLGSVESVQPSAGMTGDSWPSVDISG